MIDKVRKENFKNMSLRELNFSKGAAWVHARCASSATMDEVLQALQVLAHASTQAEADCSIRGLFPGSDLEVLLTRDLDADRHEPVLAAPIRVEADALRAIGDAVRREMRATGTRVMTFAVAGYGEVAVHEPGAREAVLLGAGATLLIA